MYGELIFYKDVKNSKKGKDSLLHKGYWKELVSTCKKVKLDPYAIQKKLSWNIQLNVMWNFWEKIEKKPMTLTFCDDLMDMTTNAWATEAKLDSGTISNWKLLHREENNQ